jgi:putative glutamine amidotransferase
VQFAVILLWMKPLIGITTSELRPGQLRTLQRHGEPPNPEMALGMTYVRAIEAAGGIPVVVPPVSDLDARRVLGRLEGLVLSGGPDLAPGAYGAQPHVELGPTEPRLDRFEYAMAREAVRLRLPVLGICRGAQTLNVVRGGTLHQHLPDVVGDTIAHRQTADGRIPTHPVAVAPGSALAAVLGTTELNVNSFHHQAIDRLGEGLRATATAPDGVIEAIELDGYPALGLQCELQEEYRINGRFAAVFDWFVAAAQARAAQLRGRRLSVS